MRNAHARASPWPAFEQALDFEPEQRFRHGKEAHAELGRQLAPRNNLAKGDVAAQNPLPHNGTLPTPDLIVPQTLSWVAPSLPPRTNIRLSGNTGRK